MNRMTHFDHKVRVVDLATLRALLDDASGVAHTFTVDYTPGARRVRVTYSNPDEYGRERPVTAELPCYTNKPRFGQDNPLVVLVIARMTGGSREDKEHTMQVLGSIL